MEIFSAEQIRGWDQFTIEHEPITSLDLMERAAKACFTWLEGWGYLDRAYSIYCGKGNNGGDGLALARLLAEQDCRVTVHILEFGHKGTDDFQANLERLHSTPVEVRFVQGPEQFSTVGREEILIDALLGSGLNRPVDGVTAELVDFINGTGNEIIAIDIPSGLFVDRSSKGNPAVRATHTVSFQCYKLAFLMPENEPLVGELHMLDIGLHPGYLQEVTSAFEMVEASMIRAIFRPRKNFAHKGTFGHALLVAGSYGKIGAAVLAGRACLRSGAGLLTAHVPGCGYEIMQTTLPEAMILTDDNEKMNTAVSGELGKYSVIGIGPGLGTDGQTKRMLADLMRRFGRPMVVDADALNMLASDASLFAALPPYSILTPHPGEFQRLFGAAENDFMRVSLALEKAKQHRCVIVLKGHYTFIAMPGGKGYFNTTGNAGMAKGGSGDALTGILTALLSQGYGASEAALLGVYVHGLAGDLASEVYSQEAMLAGDLIEQLGAAWREIGSGS